MRPSQSGQLGLLLIVVGIGISGSPFWSTGETRLSTVLIGLALLAFGYSLFNRAKRAPRHPPDDD